MIAVVVLSPLAEDDLVEIWCTVAAADIRAADNLVDELHQVTRLLEDASNGIYRAKRSRH